MYVPKYDDLAVSISFLTSCCDLASRERWSFLSIVIDKVPATVIFVKFVILI